MYFAWWFINVTDAWIKPFVPAAYLPDTYLPFPLPGFGLIVGIIALTLLGFHYISQRQDADHKADTSAGTALTLALATMTMGVMGGFALVFIPPWIAFRRAGNWRRGLILATSIGVAAYVLAFLLALGLDQPFGPVLVAG